MSPEESIRESPSPDTPARPFLQSGPDEVSGDGLWTRYLDVVKEEDSSSIERWQGSTNGLLTFTGIFSATVATFISQSFAQLQPDTATQAVFVGNQTVYLLARLVSPSNPTLAVPNPDISSNPFDFQVPRSAIILNSFWFLSLVLSLVCTLLATLVQEWSRDFQRASQRRLSEKTVKEAAFNHIYQRMGVDRFGLDGMTSVIVGLIHVAVVLFLVGLAIFLYPVHQVPALVVIISSAVAAAFYVVASCIPVFVHDCPYNTWLTPVFGRVCWFWYTLTFLLWNLMQESRALRDRGQRLTLFIFWLLVKGVSKYTYELFDSDIDWVYMKDLPYDLKTSELVQRWLKRRSIDWTAFMSGSRLAFVWDRMSGYLLLDPSENRDAIYALLDHLPRQISEVDTKSLSAFVVHLRCRDRFMRPLVDRMCAVDSVTTAVGSLELLRVLVHADSADSIMYDFLGGHWEIMDNTIVKRFPDILKKLETIHQEALCGVVPKDTAAKAAGCGGADGGELSVFVGVIKLRRTLLRKRNALVSKVRASTRSDEEQGRGDFAHKAAIQLLDRMLLCLEASQSFRLLPLGSSISDAQPQSTDEKRPMASTAPAISSAALKASLDSLDLTLAETLLVQNALTLAVYLVWFELKAVDRAKADHDPAGETFNGFDDATRQRNLLHLQTWPGKLQKETENVPASTEVQDALACLCDVSINILHLRASRGLDGNVAGFDVNPTGETKGDHAMIRVLLHHLVQRVTYTRPCSTGEPGTKEASEGLRRLEELGVFCAKSHHSSLHTAGGRGGDNMETVQ